MQLKGSKTEMNLLAAFAGECQARSKYDFFAQKAHEDGFEEIAGIFEKTAENEKEHAALWWKLLAGGAGTTEENLQNACSGENHEWTKMYPQFAEEAREEGFESIGALFEEVARIEQFHETRFQALAESVGQGSVFQKSAAQTWICTSCGHLHYAQAAPQSCPVCQKAQAYFAVQTQT